MASAAGQDDVNMSLDDLIKKRKLLGGRGGRGGRRGALRGRGGAPSAGSSRGGPQHRRGGVGGGRGAARAVTKRSYQPESSGDGAWQHDKFGGASASKRGRFGDAPSSSGSAASSKLIISNLDYGVSDNDVQELFREFGPVRRSAVHYDRSGRSLGTAEVMYANARDAQRALAQYNNVPLDGRPMRIQFATQSAPQPASPPPQPRAQPFRGGSARPRGGPMRPRNALRGRGAPRGGGGRGGAARKPVSKEELDRQMNEYNSQAQAQSTTV